MSIQARALNVIGLCYSSENRLMDLGFKMADIAFTTSSRIELLEEIIDNDNNNNSAEGDSERSWLAWRVGESRRRTGYFLWVRILKLLISAFSVSNYIYKFRYWIVFSR